MDYEDTPIQMECHGEPQNVGRLRKTWKVLSRAVALMIVLWFLAAFVRMILLLGMNTFGNWFLQEWSFFEEWSALDVTRYVRLVTGIGMGILTIKMLTILVYRAGWLKRARKSSGQLIVHRYSSRWLFIIPAQCVLDILFVMWAVFIEDFMFMEQCELGTAEGHPIGMLAFAALFWGVPVITLAAAVIAIGLTCVSYYRSKRRHLCSKA